MAETRRSEQTLPPEIPALEPERELPAANTRSNPRLNEAAEAIGSALGSATRQVQNARDRFTVIRGGTAHTTEQVRQTAQEKMEAAQEKVEEIKERAGTAVEEARAQVTAALENARARASRMAQEAKDSAMERARLVRLRATRFSQERPLAVIGAIGGAAFLLGVFLRVGRGRRG